MKFKDLLSILHDTAYVKKQDIFLINLLKGSVSEPDQIDIAPSTLKGYFQGNNITELAITLKNAGFSTERLTNYIEGLYELPHKDSGTFNTRYKDKLYKDVLYEKAKEKYPDILLEDMASYLAERFQEFISEAINFDLNHKTQQATPIADINEVTVSETIRELKTNNVDTFMTELKDLIYNLQDIGHKIESRVANMKATKDFEHLEWALPSYIKSEIQKGLSEETPLYSELKSEYNKLQELFDAIYQYNIEHEEEILTEALKLIPPIKINDFIEKWREATIKSRKNKYIIELNILIQNYFDGNSK